MGAAFYIPSTNTSYKYKLNNFMSSYTAELIAILRAVQYVCTLSVQNIVILSDSQAAIQAIQSYICKGRGEGVVISIVYTIVNSSKIIEIIWVPGHIGIKDNEQVDLLAKEACSDGRETDSIKVSLNDFKSLLNTQYSNKFNNLYRSTPKANWYKGIQHNISKTPWYSNIKMTRQEITNIIRLRIGHAVTNNRLYSIKQYFTPKCLKCTLGRQETLNHIIIECPTYDYARLKCFKLIGHINTDLNKILKNKNIEEYKELNNFLFTINRTL